MRFIADMGVSYSVVLHLRKQGHDVLHLRDEGLQRLIDEDVVARAADEHRIVLTFDLDFTSSRSTVARRFQASSCIA